MRERGGMPPEYLPSLGKRPPQKTLIKPATWPADKNTLRKLIWDEFGKGSTFGNNAKLLIFNGIQDSHLGPKIDPKTSQLGAKMTLF